MSEDGQVVDHGDGLRTVKNPLSLRTLLETNPQPIAVKLVSAENLPEFGNTSRYDHWVFLCETEGTYYHGVVVLKGNDGEAVEPGAVFDLFIRKGAEDKDEGSEDDGNAALPYVVEPIIARPRKA